MRGKVTYETLHFLAGFIISAVVTAIFFTHLQEYAYIIGIFFSVTIELFRIYLCDAPKGKKWNRVFAPYGTKILIESIFLQFMGGVFGAAFTYFVLPTYL